MSIPIKINIMGVEYTLTSDDDPEHLHRVAGLVDERMRLINRMQPKISPQKGAVLAALNIADELIRLRQQMRYNQEEAAEFQQQAAERARQLIKLCSQE
ncbi:cell division protein ZapA [bacterium]|nr:cell division protein ZapA [bacterium]MBU1652230.1 cell division protein ZapA [bacterium]MBU1882495.1 cell division protein ZapA [bacterium]